ncbi:PaeR7I family type II restriction endonuclease [Salinivibrio sp. VYel1]|uniref:PaeR7I family type II restriction endonuclease n=1 Tax=Salinivibrio sp. VYel1 TaxID=2490490 RepID=UPI00128DFEF3|nr:PaeR7I family type II restriction endonuclease [Salinivibrio sp. VYel1]MPX91408.1 restriction endonuclease [Salinivibrio sp. VYel1]
MALNLEGYEKRVSDAVKSFWSVREREGVRSGKTLDAFVELLTWVVRRHGLPEAIVLTGRKAQLPGFFRPTKSWDVIIMDHDTLIAAIELKSIADSFGKNANNRNEEALGSGVDIKEAFEENAFEGLTRLFTGYLILVEDCQQTRTSVQIQMKHFRAMEEFMLNPKERDTLYTKNSKDEYPAIDGVSYMNRFDILCRRLMQKNLYTAASVIKSPRSAIESGDYSAITRETSIKAFLASLASHAETIAAIKTD